MKCPMIIKEALSIKLLSRAANKATKKLRHGEKTFRRLGKTPELFQKNMSTLTNIVPGLSKRDKQIRKFKSYIQARKGKKIPFGRLAPTWRGSTKKQLVGAYR